MNANDKIPACGGAGKEENPEIYERAKKEIISHTRKSNSRDYLLEIIDFLQLNPSWKAPRGGKWNLMTLTVGKHYWKDYALLAFIIERMRKKSPTFDAVLEKHGVKRLWTY